MTDSATILVDLRVTQINGDRGIPAYSQSLTLELTRDYPRHRWLLLHDSDRPLPTRAEELGQHAPWVTVADLTKPGQPPVDVLFTGCFFFVPHKGRTTDALIPPVVRRQRPRHMGIVYDLIPLLFAERYLTNTTARGSYCEALEVLRGCDHLFAISHATRQDTIRHAAVDPRRVHCIYGDIDHTKQELMARPAAETAALPAWHGLSGPYCIYVGGDDWRKNLDAAVHAFAIFHRDHPAHQLAIVCSLPAERIAGLQRAAAAAGLPEAAVICTGRVSDEALVGLVRHAHMLVFPSLYEGLGLPVLEAYGCGTPVVGSNTSSVAELVLPELACDPHEPASIAAAMARLAGDRDVHDRSLALGRRLIAEELGWSRAAERVVEQIEWRPQAFVRRSLPRGDTAEPSGATRLALVGPRPADGVAALASSRPSLAITRKQTTFYIAGLQTRLKPPSDRGTLPRVLPMEVLPAALLRGRHDVVVFSLDASPNDAVVFEAIFRTRRTPAQRLLWVRAAWLDALHRDTAGNEPLSAIVRRGEIDALIVDSEECRRRVFAALGTAADALIIDVAATATEPDTAEACSRGAA